MYSTGSNNNKTNKGDHEDVEYLSRKALQRYMHGNSLQQNEDGENHNEINNNISNSLENDKKNEKKDNIDSKRVTGKSNNNDRDEQESESISKLNKESTDQDFEHMLRLDNANDSKLDDVDGNVEEDDDEGEDKLLSKLVDETNDKDDDDDDDDDEREGDRESEDQNDALNSSAGNGLLESLTTDIEKYHKKVQLKKKFDHSTLAKENKIAKDLNKSQENPENPKKRKLESEAQIDNITITNDNSNESKDKDLNINGTNNEPPNKKAKTTSKKISSWTKAEDDAIVYYKEEMKYSWKKIEELLEQQHSWQAIQMRYLRNHKSRNDEWSRFMEIRLINLIRKDWENRWKRISAELGKDFGPERCITKNIEICKKMELPYFSNVFTNKDITSGYKNQFNDIKDAEAHKKLMLVYMGLDSITYEDSDNEDKTDLNKIPNSTDSTKLITASIKDSKNTSQSTVESTTDAVAVAAAAAVAVSNTDPEEEIIHDNNTTDSTSVDKPAETSDINKMIGMNMNMTNIEGDEDNNGEDNNEDNNQGEDITSNVDPAIAGEGISK